jgi:hypothetical protein
MRPAPRPQYLGPNSGLMNQIASRCDRRDVVVPVMWSVLRPDVSATTHSTRTPLVRRPYGGELSAPLPALCERARRTGFAFYAQGLLSAGAESTRPTWCAVSRAT